MRSIIPLAILLLLALPGAVSAQVEPSAANQTVKLYLFWKEGCPHCEAEQEFLQQIKPKYPELAVYQYEISSNRQIFQEFARRYNASPQYVPATFIGDKFIGGFSDSIGRQIENQIIRELDKQKNVTTCLPDENLIEIPFLGELDPASVSLPVFTIVIGALDSINPCAFFILLFLLSLMVHAQSRTRMLIIGVTFVFFSGFIYFLFMAAWLNMFLVLGQVALITTLAGVIALVIGGLNVKEFFFFKEGPSLTIPDSAKPKLFERMRNLVRATDYASMLAGTAVLAIAANSYELLCTAGFPLVYTRVLTLNNLTSGEYYLYLAFYNIVYVLPLLAIVLMFTWTLGSRKLKEEEGKALKLLSGIMMALLGLILVFNPNLLNNVAAAAGILVLSIAATAAIYAKTRPAAVKTTR
ncbi:MAG: glutaredoxin domain-containing protein [Candidatus Altiarchaeota archaeon]